MKLCSKCGKVYSDDTLNFCLDDGEGLVETDQSKEFPTALHRSNPSTARATNDQSAAATEATAVYPVGIRSERQTPPWLDRRFWFVAVVAFAAAIGGTFIYRNYSSESASPINSIAVLPFQNRSADADTQYLSEGLAESLIYRLSQIESLKVSPTSSVFFYENKDIDPTAVGKELGVNAVLSGRIVQHGDDLTISANLVDVRTNRLLWGEQYERKMSQLLDTQREIAREIVENLKLKVTPNERGLTKHYTESNEAYQLYLKGRYYWSKRTNESMHRSIELYQQSIDTDPNFALAYSGIADTYDLICAPEAGGGDEAPNDVLPKARAAALKAIDLDPTLAEPHVSLAHVLMYYDHDFPAAEREFKKALELNPKYATAHHWYAIYLSILGRHDEALVEIKRSKELDPLSLAINVWVGWIMTFAGQTDQALDQLLKTKEMDPNFLLTRHRLALLYADLGRYDDAVAEANEMLRISNGRLGALTLGYIFARQGKRKEALEQIDSMIAESQKRFMSPGSIALIYAVLGDKDEAFKLLEKANVEHDLLVVRIKNDPRFAKLRGDPRLDDLAKRMHLP